MLPSDLNLSIGKTKGYNSKILVTDAGMKISSSRDINHYNLTPPEPGKIQGLAHAAPKMHLMKDINKPVKDHLAAQHDNRKMLAEKHNDDKLAIKFLIVVAGLIASHF